MRRGCRPTPRDTCRENPRAARYRASGETTSASWAVLRQSAAQRVRASLNPVSGAVNPLRRPGKGSRERRPPMRQNRAAASMTARRKAARPARALPLPGGRPLRIGAGARAGSGLRIGAGARFCGAADLGLRRRVAAKKTAKIRGAQNEHAAIAEGDDVGLPPPPAQQGHLAEKIAAAEPHPLVRQYHLDRARGDEEHRVAALPPAHDRLVRHQQPRPKQAGQRLYLALAEPCEHVKPPDQRLGAQPQIERRQRASEHRRRLLALESVEQLPPDQTFLIEIAIAGDQQAQAGLLQKAALEPLGVLRILQTQRVERAPCRRGAGGGSPSSGRRRSIVTRWSSSSARRRTSSASKRSETWRRNGRSKPVLRCRKMAARKPRE